MFNHLLVPLDGSSLAESALPAAAYIAKTLGSSVTLIHVIEHHAPSEVHSNRHLTQSDEAQAYLKEVAEKYFAPEVPVETHVHTTEVSDVARSIVEHAAELDRDLIIMCTHGRGGVRDLIYGNIAQQIISMGQTPVLLIRPSAEEPAQSFRCKKLLVPLDGNPEHEQGLPLAASLAKACGLTVHLLMVVNTLSTLKGESAAASKLLPGAASVMLEMEEIGGSEYLQSRLEHLKGEHVSVTAEIGRGDPAKVIVKTAEESDVDLIVLGTHGKSGMDAFWAGSTSPKISSHTRIPLLLVPVNHE